MTSNWGLARRWQCQRWPRREAAQVGMYSSSTAPPRSHRQPRTTIATPAGGCTLASSCSSGAMTPRMHILPTFSTRLTLTLDPTVLHLVPVAVPQRAAPNSTFRTRCSHPVVSRTRRTSSVAWPAQWGGSPSSSRRSNSPGTPA